GGSLENSGKKGLSHTLSRICDALYAKTPVLWNELINRQSLSSQGVAARRRLIEAMLTKPTQQLLGIEGYPPERSMYESLLHAGRLHVEEVSGSWAFRAIADKDPLR